MRFPLIHHGRRFFFFTFVTAGRQPILSRLVRGESRPILTTLGQRVAAFWRQVHQLDAHLTASHFVIMPDHVHLLLMVNSEGEFRFNPLVFGHWFQAMTSIDEQMRSAPLCWDAPTVEPADLKLIWEHDFWVNISFDARQLAAIRRYIKMNPARYFWKCDHADLFRCVRGLKHPLLAADLPWCATGDITLLANPFLYWVRLTRKKTLAELEPEIADYVALAQQGWTPLCGFISPGEREFELRLKVLPNTRWIKAVPYGLPERYDPSVEDSKWIAERRQLVLSSFSSAEFPPFQITRAACLLMNERLATIARLAQPFPPQQGDQYAFSLRE